MPRAVPLALASSLTFVIFAGHARAQDSSKSPAEASQTPQNLAAGVDARASSVWGRYVAAFGVDRRIHDDHRWVSKDVAGPHWLELRLPASFRIGSAHVWTGWGEKSAVRNFELEAWIDQRWLPIAGSRVRKNRKVGRRVLFDRPVETARVRLVCEDKGRVRVKELLLWPAGVECPALRVGLEGVPRAPDMGQHHVFANQMGYDEAGPKRFTAPISPDGTRFEHRRKSDGARVYASTIRGGSAISAKR